jgi:hypothetical protein
MTMYDEPKSQLKSISPERSSTEIEGCMNRVNNALDRLHSRVGSVEDRLHPVMRATGPGGQGSSTGVPQEALSPLGDAIRSIEQRVDSAVDRLEALCIGLAL